MIETALVYIRKPSAAAGFVGCGVLIEGGYLATCRHVWAAAAAPVPPGDAPEVVIEYPHAPAGVAPVPYRAFLADPCETAELRVPDLVLLRPETIPTGVRALSLATHHRFEVGSGYALAGLVGRDAGSPGAVEDVPVRGTIEAHVNAAGLRSFRGDNASGYWTDRGASGAPLFLDGGEQLAGILRLSETGANRGASHLHEAFILPATTIRRHLEHLAARPEAVRQGIMPADLQAVLDAIGAPDVPLVDIPARLLAFVRDAQARGAEPVAPSNAGTDIAATIGAARARLGALDAAGALALLQAKIAEEEQASTQRMVPLLRERAAVERLSFQHDAAKATLAELTRLTPDDVWAWIDLGDLWVTTGLLTEAKTAYRAAEAAARRIGAARDLSVSHNKIGGVLRAEGKREDALAAYRASIAIRETLARSDPGNAGWQRDLSVSHNKIGDVLRAEGKREDALAAFRAGLAIAETLARSDPGNAEWQRDLSVSHNKIGDVLRDEGKREDALAAFRAGLAIRETLARSDPGNAGWQRDLSVSHEKIGDVLLAEGKREDALAAYRTSLAIRETLARSDPGNAEWQRDLIVSCVRIADASPDEARARLTQALAIAHRLATEGRLAPVDAWMPDDIARRLAALPPA